MVVRRIVFVGWFDRLGIGLSSLFNLKFSLVKTAALAQGTTWVSDKTRQVVRFTVRNRSTSF